jgi:molybdopterin-guanine dinucleotide biosynthesis protein A
MSVKLPAVVIAGGRISGEFAQIAGTTIKALAPVAGRPVIAYLLEALRQLPQIETICVVGPQEIKAALGPSDLWVAETGQATENFRVGAAKLGTPERLLFSASDLPMVTAESLADFLSRAPEDADICLPLMKKESYLAMYPDGRDAFVRLKEGEMTAGSQFLLRTEPVLRSLPLIERLFSNRKSQIGMAMAIGPVVVAKFLAGRLRVNDVEGKLSALSSCRCRAALDCRPELAFDIDDLASLRYAEQLKSAKAQA